MFIPSGLQIYAAVVVAFASLVNYVSLQGTLVDILSTDDNYSMLWSLLSGTDLKVVLSLGQYTIFAPNNAAFDALSMETKDSLTDPSNVDLLMKTLYYHTVLGDLVSSDLSDGTIIDSAADISLVFEIGENIIVNDATVIQSDIEAANGIIHEISNVLSLPIVTDFLNYGIGSTLQLSLWKNLMDLTEFEYDANGVSFTLFFATNEAVERLESEMTFDFLGQTNAPGEGICFHAKYLIQFFALCGAHLANDFQDGEIDEDRTGYNFTINQNPFRANGVEIIFPDVKARNGVIHVAGEVPLPSWGTKNIIETLQGIST